MDSIEDINALDSTNDLDIVDTDLLSTLPFTLLPSFLWSTAISIQNRDPAHVLLSFLTRTKYYHAEITQSVDFSLTEFQTSCTRLFQFLWLCKHGEVASLVTLPPEDDNEILNWNKFHHAKCLGQINICQNPTINLPPPATLPIVQQDHTMQNTIIQESLNQIAKLAPEPKRKGSDKLHDSTKKLILQASSSNGEMIAAEPCEDCKEFFKAPNHSDARTTLLELMSNKWNCNVDITQGAVTNLCNGRFTREYLDTPQNFSPFSFPKRPFMKRDHDKDSLSLQLKEMSGKGLSSEDINNALEQRVIVPM